MASAASKALLPLALGAALLVPIGVSDAASANVIRAFGNCTAMHKYYPHGVGLFGAHDKTTGAPPVTNFTRAPRVYRLNAGSDRDGDHVACEAH